MNTQGRGRNNRSRQEDPIQDIINRVKNAASLKEVFRPENYALHNGWAHRTAKMLNKDAMNTNQLRKVFTQLKTIESKMDRNPGVEITHEQKNEVLLIMPQIAYARGRNLIPVSFYNLMKECVRPEKIRDKEDYKSFVGFFTAVIAYSKMGR